MMRTPIPLMVFLTTVLTACEILPVKTDIKENHARLENFISDKTNNKEYISLMCKNKKPTKWMTPTQILAGEHNIWIEIKNSQSDTPNSERISFINVNVIFDEGKSYTLNRKRENNRLTVWIQELSSGSIVSEVIRPEMKYPLYHSYEEKRRHCLSSSI